LLNRLQKPTCGFPQVGFLLNCMYMRLASCVVVSAQQVHGLAQLVQEDEGADNDQAAQNIPAPERACAETVGDAAAGQFVAHTGADPMAPYDGTDAQGDGSYDEKQQAVVHSLLAVITGGNEINIGGEIGVEHDGVDTEGDEAQQQELDHTAVGFQLCHDRDLFSLNFWVRIIIKEKTEIVNYSPKACSARRNAP